MSTVQNFGVPTPMPSYVEPRIAQGQNPAPQRDSAPVTPPKASVTDEVRVQAQEARDANRARAEQTKEREQDKVEVTEAAKYASKVGLVEGTFAPFVDIVDARFQQRIARIFGPSDRPVEAPAAVVEAPKPEAIRKAYEGLAGAAAGTYRQSA